VNRELMLTPLPAGKLPAWLLRKVLPVSATDPSVLVGPGVGRDAAAIAVGDRVIVAKSDPITFASEGGVDHLVDVNANDIACMGAAPRWLLVTGLLPEGVTPADVLRDFAGLREACRRRAVDLVGGHTEIVPGLQRPILVGMMLGETTPDDLLRPGQARTGDALLLTKRLAIEGTALIARERAEELEHLVGSDVVRDAARLLSDPGISIVRDAELARASGGVAALHDPTEGGLAMAVREIATVSGAGVEIDRDLIPVYTETRIIADALGLDPLGMLGSGALLIAADPRAVPIITRDLAREGIPVTSIGRLTADPEDLTLLEGGERRPLPEFLVDEVARALNRPTLSLVDQPPGDR
jgi:hydrogenase expression/formation protein HypE